MTPSDLLRLGIRPAFSLLPGRMDSVAAQAMVLAICLQESECKYRRQFGGGPAVGYPQFEPIGVEGVLSHRASSDHARSLCRSLDVPVDEAHAAIQYNDVLAAGFTRLSLWRLPAAMPDGRMDYAEAWRQYIEVHRPGKPRQEKWKANYLDAWKWVTSA